MTLTEDIANRTDAYFNRTRDIIARFGDKEVTYACFLRRPVISAPRLMLDWLRAVAAEQGFQVTVDLTHAEGEWVGAGEPLVYLKGSFQHLSNCETLFLQKLGPACVAAHNAYQMSVALPKVAFLAMDARHCAGAEMQDMMGYAAGVGSTAAQKEGARGFVGTATELTAHWFGQLHGAGTMPHALIGYAGSTVRAAEMFVETFPDQELTVLTDYFGREITDGIAVCQRFPERAAAGRLSVRLDTHGGRFLEGLDPAESYAVLERRAPGAIRRYRKRRRVAQPGRHRRVRRRHLAHARGLGRGGLSAREDRGVVRLQRGEVPGDGGHAGADRRGGHGQLHPGCLERDLRDRRHRGV